MKKTQVIIVSVFGLLVLLVIWTISAMKGKEENQNTVRLSTDNKDVTITDVKAQLERDRKSTRLNSSHMPKSRMPSSA